MKIFKNKFFLSVISIIFLLFSLQFYFISNSYKRDTNSYITLLKWAWTLATNDEKIVLKLQEKQKIQTWDIINILSNSLAVIEWWDKSITRLGESTQIKIKENFTSDDLSKINISFELLKWKTWSNVISIMTWESYFKQEVNWATAAVRWTVFEANYDEDYMMVHSHEIKVTNSSWEEKYIYPWEIFSLKNFSLERFRQKVDETRTKLNQNLDKEYLKNLRENFLNSLKQNPLNLYAKFSSENKVYNMLALWETRENVEKYISSLPEDKKQKILNSLNTLNQTLNFENWENSFLYNLKLNTRNLIIDNSNDTNLKQTLVKYSIYDLSEIFSYNNFSKDIFDNTINFVSNNKEYIDFQKENFKALWENSEVIKQIFSLEKEDITPQNIKTKLSEINENSKEVLNKGLNKILEIYQK